MFKLVAIEKCLSWRANINLGDQAASERLCLATKNLENGKCISYRLTDSNNKIK
jgi:hypothetical protein